MSRTAGWVLVSGLLAATALMVSPPSSGAATARTGSVTVTVTGLPSGERPSAVFSGPGGRRRIAHVRSVLRVRPGWHLLTLKRTRTLRRHGAVRAGALALPGAPVTVFVRAGRRARVTAAYTSLVNPGLVGVSGGVVGVSGPPENPTAVVFSGRRALRAGEVLSMRPSANLPRGLLKRVRSVRFASRRTTAALGPVSVFTVVPVVNFQNVPGTVVPSGAADAVSPNAIGGKCSLTPPDNGPYREVKNVKFSGGWDTVNVFGVHIPVGVRLAVDFDAEAGLKAFQGFAFDSSCELDISATGMAGPVPVTGAIYGKLTAGVSAGLQAQAGVSMHITAAANSVGVPPDLLWVPSVHFSSPHVTFSAQAIAQATASIGVGVKVGLGSEDIAAATLDFNNSLKWSAQPGECSMDATFGAFSAEGKLAGWTIHSPETSPLYTDNLWNTPCGSVTTTTTTTTTSSTTSGGPDPGFDDGGWVSCTSSTFCLATGSSHANAVSWVYNGHSWSAPASGAPSTVSCRTPTFCAGLTDSGTSTTGTVFNGAGWSSPTTLGGTSSDQTAVSCGSTSFCMALVDGQHWATFTGQSWSGSHSMPSGAYEGVSCASATFCVASGRDGSFNSAVTVFNGTSWSTPVAVPGMSSYELAWVSCPSSAFCAVAGAGPNPGTYVATYSGGTWHTAALAAPAATNGGGGFSCASATSCTLVSDGLKVYRYNGSSWSGPQTIPLPPQYAGGPPPIEVPLSCPTASFCLGTMWVSPLTAVFNGTSWAQGPPV